MKKLLSWILVLALCLSLFPCVALAEDAEEPVGEIAPVEEPVPSLENDGGLSGPPAPTEEDQTGALVGDGVLEVPADDPAARPTDPAADEIQAGSGSCGTNLTWTLDEEGLLTISGTGEMTNWSIRTNAPWYSQRTSIREVRIEVGVTSIGVCAFYNCSSLTSVTIPESVTSIETAAFEDCRGLTSVTIPEGVASIKYDTFRDCSSLASVTIPSSVTSIGSSAFYGCSSLTSVTIGNGVTSIGGNTFYNCSSLTSVTIPEGVTSIGDSAFTRCSGLEQIIFLGAAPAISSSAFAAYYDSNSYSYIYVRATAMYPIDNETWTADKLQNYGAQSLTWMAYREVPALYTIHFDPNGGSSAPADQFKGHGVDLTLPTSKPILAGYRCLGWAETPDAGEPLYAPGALYSPDGDATLYAVWEEVMPGEKVVAGGSCGADLNWAYYENGLLKIYGSGEMNDWTYPDAYQARPAPWYQYRDSITELQLPEGLTGIGSYAFSDCKYITRLEIPASVTSIGNSAFSGCSGLSRVTIPSSVTSIGEYAFSY